MTEQRFRSEYLSLTETLYRIAFYILESRDEAEDAVQEVFLRLWRDREKLDAIQNPKAYCIRMLRNLCLDRIRAVQRLSFPEELPELPSSRLQDDELDEKQRLDKVLEAIKALPDRQREIMMLRVVDGLSYEEISRRTSQNYLTLRVLLSRARAKLKSEV